MRIPWGSQSRDAVPLWPPKSQGTAEYFATAAVAGYNTWAPKAMGGSILISRWLEDLGVSEKNASNYPKDAWLIDSKLGWTRTQSETINTRLVGGFNPPEKYWSVGLMIPNIWKIKNVPNHQPVHVATRKSNHPGQKGQKQKTQKTHHCEHAAVAQNPGARERDGSPAEVKCHPNEPSLAVIVHRCI